MRKKAFIHIGIGKTGTTSIQETLSTQKRKLAGIGYPNIVGNSHHFLEVIYKHHSRLSRGHRSEYVSEQDRSKHASSLKKKFLKRASNNRNIIISSEFLCRFRTPEILSLKSDLDASGYTDYRIICYVRDPVSYFKSALQQKLKASHHPSGPRNFWYDVRNVIESYQRCYGDNVIVRAYDEHLFHEGDVVLDFLHQAEQFFDVKFKEIETYSTNRSFSAEALFILQKYRELYDFDKDNFSTPKSQLLLEYLMELPSSETTPIELNPDVERIICDRFEEQNLWLKKNYNIDFFRPTHEADLHGKPRNRNYDLLENIVRKPSEFAIDQIKFDLIDKFMGLAQIINKR